MRNIIHRDDEVELGYAWNVVRTGDDVERRMGSESFPCDGRRMKNGSRRPAEHH